MEETASVPLLDLQGTDLTPSSSLPSRQAAESPGFQWARAPRNGILAGRSSHNTGVNSARFERLLRNLPPPKENKFLRLAFSLVYGTGLRWKGVYPINLLLLLVVVAGAVSEVTRASWKWSVEYLPVVKKEGGKPTVGLIVRLISLHMKVVLLAGAYVFASLRIHKTGNAGRTLSQILPVPEARMQFCGAQRRTKSWLRGNVAVFFIMIFGAVVSVVNLILFIQRVEFTTTSYQITAKQALTSISGVFWTWTVVGLCLHLAVFYDVTDDVIQVGQEVPRRVKSMFGEREDNAQELLALQGDRKRAYHETVELVHELNEYMDLVLAPWKKWLVFQMMTSLLIALTFFLSSVFLLFDSLRSRYPLNASTEVIICLSIAFSYIVPLHGAAKVTSMWDHVISDLLIGKTLLRQSPVDFLCLASWLPRLRGGFVVCGFRVRHQIGFHVIPILLSLATLSRYL